MKRFLVLLALGMLIPVVSARTELIVAGQEVPGLDQQTVAGVSYAPAREYARAIGAELEIAFSTVELRLGGRLLQLRLTGDPARAADPDSVAIDGRTADGHAAIHTDAGVLLPVKTVAAAFGGFVTVLGGARDAVEVRLPTANITGFERAGSGTSERLVVSLSLPVPVRTFHNERLNMLEVHFGRTRQPEVPELEGNAFLQAWFLKSGQEQEPELRVRLAPGTDWSMNSVPTGTGWQLEFTFSGAQMATGSPEAAAAARPAPVSRTILLDPLAQPELVDLALAVATELRLAGIEVALTRAAPAEASTTLLGAATADIHLRLAAGSGSALQFLGDVTGDQQLQLATELAGGDATVVERLRRQLLLGNHTDLDSGAQTANLLAEQLGLAQPVSLPLAELVPAAGKGVRLELDSALLADPGLPKRLAAGLLRALEAR